MRGFTDHNEVTEKSYILVAHHDRGWQHAGSTLHVSQGTIKLMYILMYQFNMKRQWNVDLRLCVFDLHFTRRENSPLFRFVH